MLTSPLQLAESYIGFRSRALRTNDFGAKAGHNTKTWAGSFVQVVLQESNWDDFYAFAHTTSALNFCKLFNLTVTEPREGDIVFYTFPTDLVDMGQQHIGIVADVQKWKSQGIFQAIEGETAPNSSKKHVMMPDGVFKRTRYAAEVAEFVRLDRLKVPKLRRNAPLVLPSDIHFLRNGDSVAHVQRALADVFGNRIRGVRKGIWDAGTAHTYGEWQRMMGFEATGLPSDGGLGPLGRLTGRFVAG